MAGGLWSVLTVLGPILLIGVIAWAMLRNRAGTKREVDRAEQGAADLRQDMEDGTHLTDDKPR
jgi:cbb3-type cytochrome oxidase subunit 3